MKGFLDSYTDKKLDNIEYLLEDILLELKKLNKKVEENRK